MAIDSQTIKKAHTIMLDMLIAFDKICQKHSLDYWLDAGTLLGAVRHQGFIPWDDDIDISMPLEDYQKFMQIAQKELPSSMFLQHKATDKAFPFDYMKIRDNRATITEFHEESKDVKYHQGLFLDIFPMLTIENNSFNKNFYADIFKLIRSVSSVGLHTPNGIDKPELRLPLLRLLESMHMGWKDIFSKIIYAGEMPDVAKWYDYEGIYPLQKMSFEGLKFSVPYNSRAYLIELYGKNYMEIPPKEKQRVHASKIEFLN